MFNNVKQSATLLSTDKHDNSKGKNGGTKLELKKKEPKNAYHHFDVRLCWRASWLAGGERSKPYRKIERWSTRLICSGTSFYTPFGWTAVTTSRQITAQPDLIEYVVEASFFFLQYCSSIRLRRRKNAFLTLFHFQWACIILWHLLLKQNFTLAYVFNVPL